MQISAFRCLVLSIFMALSLSACGGGGGSSNNGSNSPSATNNTPKQTKTSSCPASTVDDAWLNNRLPCLTVGQQVIDTSAGATQNPADTWLVVKETVDDSSFNNILGTGTARYFAYFLCVKGLPSDVNMTYLSGDLAVAIGTSNGSSTIPPGVGAISLGVGLSNGITAAQEHKTCDPTMNPVIVDYSTGKITSINPDALNNIQMFDFTI